ncbi:dynein axonemal heavy chain 2-like [Diachasmimorpha longicaudata]|uniref:dynein axonemal heavy chain 2-like n=1 Tax=Diachasmimorpha longicaudata TaxID=58733 RepID=UPI0030B88648
MGKQIKVIFANREEHKNSFNGKGPPNKEGVYSSINKMQRQKDKVEDEFGGDSKRGYLDAASSDEDESRVDALGAFGDNRDSVSRIFYDDEELQRIIDHMKNLTTIGGIENEDWSGETLSIMRDFIELPGEKILSIYFRGNVLKAELNIPSTPVYEMTYFIRKSTEVLQYENFQKAVLFGTNNDKVEGNVQTIVDTLLAPICFRMKEWPDSVKADFCDALHEYLYKVNDLRFKMYSLTMLYLPREGIDMTIEEASTSQDFVQRLEGIVVHWMKQMRLTINDYEQFTSQELLCLIDEYDFWIYRYENLCALNYQLQSPAVDRILNILKTSDSTYFRPFMSLHREINGDIEEAKSNITFLEILRDASAGLNNCYNLEDISKHILRILHLFRFIWLNSPFYNTQERMTHLFILLNNQIILVCHRFLDPRKILMTGSTRWGMKMLERATDVCRYYKKIYVQFVNACDTSTTRPWTLKPENVFRNVDVFLERCRDFYEICRAAIDFARLDETVTIPVPSFGGTQGQDHQKVCMKVENIFRDHLHHLYENSRKMFSVQEVTWHDDMSTFRAKTKDLDIMIQNLMNVTFKGINNVGEAVAYLYGLRMYMNRNSLMTHFNGMITSIWRSFSKESQTIKQELLKETSEYPSSCPYFSGRALNLLFKSKRLKAVKDLLENAEWMGYCTISDEVYHQTDVLLGSINDMIVGIHHQWMDDIDSNPQSGLDRYLMRQNSDKLGTLETNLDYNALNLCYEASIWRYLGFQIPVYVEIIIDKWPILQFVSESVLMLVSTYNKVIEALSSEEKILFKPLLKIQDRELRAGLSKLTWNSEFIDTYIKGCWTHMRKLQNFLDIYKISNRAILNICEEISLMKIVDVKPNYIYTIQEFVNELRTNSIEAISTPPGYFQVTTQ